MQAEEKEKRTFEKTTNQHIDVKAFTLQEQIDKGNAEAAAQAAFPAKHEGCRIAGRRHRHRRNSRTVLPEAPCWHFRSRRRKSRTGCVRTVEAKHDPAEEEKPKSIADIVNKGRRIVSRLIRKGSITPKSSFITN